jgi:CDP-diacylglycerol--glycerol-3-phosphate 3-phosphatidyltransferase
VSAFSRVQSGYITGVRRFAASSMAHLARSQVSPNLLTALGVGLSVLGGVAVWFEYRGWGWFWVGALLFVLGAIFDILDGALARSRGVGSPFGAFIDSTVDRIGEAFMLGSLALVFMRWGYEWGVAFAFAALAGSFLVSYTRARAEALGLKGDVGLGSRAERVVVITTGLVLAPIDELILPIVIGILAATAWITVLQRVLAVRRQLRERG